MTNGRLFRDRDLGLLAQAAAAMTSLAEIPTDARQIALLVALVFDSRGWEYESIREFYGGVLIVGDDGALIWAAWGAQHRTFAVPREVTPDAVLQR